MKKRFSLYMLFFLLFSFAQIIYATPQDEPTPLGKALIGAGVAGMFGLFELLWILMKKIFKKPNEKAKKVEEELLAAKKNVTDERLNTTRKDGNIIVAQSAAYKNNFCRKCGAELLEESKFCHKCGAETILEKNKVQS